MSGAFPSRINLVGRFASGKGFISDILCEVLGFKDISYSDALYLLVAEEAGLTVEEVKARKGEFRSRLQEIGHGARQADPDHWINEREKLVEKYREKHPLGERAPVVESGTRYENEALSCIKLGGLVLRVKVPHEVRMERYKAVYKRYPSEAEISHVTEVAVDTLPVHAEIPGNMPRELVLPTIRATYARLKAMGLVRGA
jgi:dephospho-CoA kinase